MTEATKVCIKCDVKKPEVEYNFRHKERGIRHNTCKTCHSYYRRQHYEDNKEKYKAKARHWNRENMYDYRAEMRRYVFEYLLEHPCVDCGENDPIVLEFDHVKGEKILAISAMLGSMATMERLQAEIDKCEVRCANCHRRKTAKERGWHIVDLMAEYESKK
ncbi:MAG: hypothetical protein AAF846_26980 [Chloroflexota bacterium]